MTKYKELVEEYENWIESIKADTSKLDRLRREIDTTEDRDAWAELVEAYGDISEALTESRHALDDMIRREYELVPFKQIRARGISGFYREAGLTRPS